MCSYSSFRHCIYKASPTTNPSFLLHSQSPSASQNVLILVEKWSKCRQLLFFSQIHNGFRLNSNPLFLVSSQVLDEYPDGNAWLGERGYRSGTSSKSGEWPVSYHGTSKPGANGIIVSKYEVNLISFIIIIIIKSNEVAI